MPLIKLGRDQVLRLRRLDAVLGGGRRVVWLAPAIMADFAYRDAAGRTCYGRAPVEWLLEVQE